MRYDTEQHQYYCGVDWHARTLYLCIVNQVDEMLVHREIPAKADDSIIRKMEWHMLRSANTHDAMALQVLRTIPGVGEILSLVRLYEIQDISRFPTPQTFASSARVIRPVKASAGNRTGTANGKIGHAYVKWAVSEAVVLCLRETREAQPYIRRVERKYGQDKAKGMLAHRLGRTVYSMLKNTQVFDRKKFVHQEGRKEESGEVSGSDDHSRH